MYLVESVLQPSKAIRKGFEPIVVITDDGKSITGLLAEDRPDALVLRDPAQDGKTITIPKDRIEEQAAGPALRHAGGTGHRPGRSPAVPGSDPLPDRDHREGADAGSPTGAAAALVRAAADPGVRKDIDHAGLLAELNPDAFQRGEAIYNYVCVNCHGTKDQPGSLPTSLRFACGTFKNGCDPYRMYQTLTKGYGMMMPQTWMVPQQKYDVIHYIREAYLKPYNPTQYAPVDADYLAGLPTGTGRGPQPETIEPWITMDYGPHLTATYEVGSDQTNFAYKGIAVRLDPGPGGVSRGSALDAVRPRHAAGRRGLERQGLHRLGRDPVQRPPCVHPRLVGQMHLANPTGPAGPTRRLRRLRGPAIRGRDNRPYGPLPRDWAHYRGLYDFGNQVILAYTVGRPRCWKRRASRPPRRCPSIPARSKSARQRGSGAAGRATSRCGGIAGGRTTGRVGRVRPRRRDSGCRRGRATSRWRSTARHMSRRPSRTISIWRAATTRSRPGSRPGPAAASCARRQPTDRWVPDGKSLFVRGGRLVFDLGWVGAVTSRRAVDDGAWHDVAMTWEQETGRVRLYVDGRLDGEGNLKPRGN